MATAEQLITEKLAIWSSAIKAKSASGRGKSRKFELYGIKKLRELILELAVRGLLVPQDPSDAPASQVLKKIAAEKARLVEDGKIKRPKALPPIADDEKTFELPRGWEWIKLGNLMEMYNGRAFKKSEWSDKGLPIVRIQNLNDRTAPFNHFEGELADHHKIDSGTFLISWSGTPGTSFGAFVWNRGPGALNQHINKCEIFLEESNYEYLRIAVTGCMDHLIANAQGGVGLKHVTKGTLNNTVLGFPPLKEQARIVAKVDELMALCDQLEQQQEDSITAHQTLVQTLLDALTTASERDGFTAAWARIADHFDTLFTTEWSIDQLKQTILQLAVMGKLVPQAPDDEPAGELLKKIAAEKARLIKDKKIKKQKTLPVMEEDEKPFELPGGWVWARLADVYDVRDGTHDTPKYQEKGYPLVTSKNLYSGKLDLSNVKYISASDHKKISERSKVDNLDILFAMIGSIGNPVLIETDVEFSIKNVALFKYYSRDLSCPDFLLRYLLFAEAIFRDQASGAVQSFVSLGKIRGFPIGLPPLGEQARIVAKVNELMVLCDTLKASINTAQATQLQLADAMAASGSV